MTRRPQIFLCAGDLDPRDCLKVLGAQDVVECCLHGGGHGERLFDA